MENEQFFRPIHYLGSKLRILNQIKTAVDSVDSTKGTICDLFSGSGTVSKYMLNYRDVVAVDIQQYSKVLCEASMSKLNCYFDKELFFQELSRRIEQDPIRSAFSLLLKHENDSIVNAQYGRIDDLYEIIEHGSLYVYMNSQPEAMSQKLNLVLGETTKRLRLSNLSNSVDTMNTRYFGGLYFSYKQTVEFDIISSVIFRYEGLLHVKLLAALLSSASEMVNTVGKQFAQPLKVRDSKGNLKKALLKKILSDRSLDAFEIYRKWVEFYLHAGTDSHVYSVICSDYLSALESLKNKPVSVIYADPPYTRYHYSRYYHVLETMCLRDNPEVSTSVQNGRRIICRAIYRVDRHQSPFCIKNQVEKAFDVLFEKAHALKVPLVLSYSPFEPKQAVSPRLQTIDQLIYKAKQYYGDVSVISSGEFTHSKLNSVEKLLETSHEAELLIICK